MSVVFLKLIQITVGLRVSLEEEIIGADIVEHAIGGVFYNKKTRMIESGPANKEEPDIIRHYDQPIATIHRRQSHIYGRRFSTQSGSCKDSLINNQLSMSLSEEVDVSKRNSLLIKLKNIMNWCKTRKTPVLFSPKDYVTPDLPFSLDNEIYDLQGNLSYPSIPSYNYVEGTNRENITVTYV